MGPGPRWQVNNRLGRPDRQKTSPASRSTHKESRSDRTYPVGKKHPYGDANTTSLGGSSLNVPSLV